MEGRSKASKMGGLKVVRLGGQWRQFVEVSNSFNS